VIDIRHALGLTSSILFDPSTYYLLNLWMFLVRWRAESWPRCEGVLCQDLTVLKFAVYRILPDSLRLSTRYCRLSSCDTSADPIRFRNFLRLATRIHPRTEKPRALTNRRHNLSKCAFLRLRRLMNHVSTRSSIASRIGKTMRGVRAAHVRRLASPTRPIDQH
jgi:hypothetical protein